MKKVLSVILALALLLTALSAAASAAPSARLYNVYADGMIFKQNADAIFAGTANAGALIKAELKDASGAVVASGESAAEADGTFSVSFPSPAGSFTQYTVELSENGAVFRTLSRVVFGEIWLAAGQSNMGYTYKDAEDYVSPAESASEEKSFIRLFRCPDLVEYKGSADNLPALPQNEIPGCGWMDANDPRCDSYSAVAYFFALDLAQSLDVPLGMVSLPLGASSILTWLPREAIEGSAAVTARAKANGEYYSLADWPEQGVPYGETGPTNYFTMTTLYNKKVYPVRNFRYSGMIWYQGETDIYWTDAEYAEALDLMQDCYSELFGQDGDLPLIWTQLAPYYYSDNETATLRNIAFTEMQLSRPDSRALVTSCDYPATYLEQAGAIHPQSKKPVSERMSFAAQRLVYGRDGDYTLPTVESFEIRDGGVAVTFRDAGDGLVCEGSYLRGFSIAGENGVYVRADAEITGENTVFIHADEIPQPASAAYAFAVTCDSANLYASENGEPTLPASAFILDRESERVSYQNNVWTECEEAQAWHTTSSAGYCAFYDTWTANDATAAIDPDAAYEGEAGLRIKGDCCCFSVSPTAFTGKMFDRRVLSDMNDDWRDYSAVSVMLRNDGENDVTLKELRVQTAWFFIRVPVVAGTNDTTCVIPADGQWHKVTFDLDTVYAGDALLGPPLDGSSSLEYITGITFRFEGRDADVCLDDVRFAPRDGGKGDVSGSVKSVALWILNPVKTVLRFFERIRAMFAKLF